MIAFQQMADLLVDTLQLDTAPVALRFVQQAPDGVAAVEGEVPSACTFWRRAEQGTFYAPAAAHFNCLVGTHTMGLPMPPAKGEELMQLVGEMGEARYLDGTEVPHIPTVPGEKRGIVYGPLAEAQGDVDVVLVWVTPAQAMILEEAAGTAAWSDRSGIPTFGRPSCAAIPYAMAHGTSALSLGCQGMRTFTEVAQQHLLGVLPGAALERLAEALPRIATANSLMAQRYRGQKALHSKPARRGSAAPA